MRLAKYTSSLCLLAASAALQAAPVTYTMTVDGVFGTSNGVAVGPNATTVIVVNADTSSVTAVGAGHCVAGTSGTIATTGINGGAAQALTGAFYVCANNAGNNVGVYPSTAYFSYGMPVHGGNSGTTTGALTGAPVVDLLSNLGPVSYIAGSVHSHGAALSLQAGGTYSAWNPEAGGTTASTFSAVVSGGPTAFVPPIANPPYVSGITLPTLLDLQGGDGPALTNCMLDTLRLALGGNLAYQGQANSGQVALSWNDSLISFFPVGAWRTNFPSAEIQLQNINSLSIGTACGTLSVTPALFNLKEFGAIMDGARLSVAINKQGVMTVLVNESYYVVRPDYLVTKGSAASPGLVMGSDGMYRFTDSAGNTQLLRPAFLDPVALGIALGGSIVIQTDGTAILTVGGQRSLLVPDQIVAMVPDAHLADSLWQDGPNHYFYSTVSVGPSVSILGYLPYAQGFTRSPIQ